MYTPEEKAQYDAKAAVQSRKNKAEKLKSGLNQPLKRPAKIAEAADEDDDVNADDDGVDDDSDDADEDSVDENDNDEFGEDEHGFVGMRVRKDFGGVHGVHFGTVVKQSGLGFYLVRYEDGDREEMDADEVAGALVHE